MTKGAGLLEALTDLGLSHHNTIGVGDAENDHTLLETCEIAVAVNNAVEAIRGHADLTLDRPDGAGVADLLRGPLLAGRARLYSRRRQITLGVDEAGDPVTIPSSRINVAICGEAGAGKSFLAGLICEQLMDLGYSVVVFDPEGDHVGLGELPTVLVTGGEQSRVADPADLVRLLQLRWASVVVDVSDLDADAQLSYGSELPSEIEAQRANTGRPQWLKKSWLRSTQATAFTPASRRTTHLRHEHKYDHSGLEPGRRLYFRGRDRRAGARRADRSTPCASPPLNQARARLGGSEYRGK